MPPNLLGAEALPDPARLASEVLRPRARVLVYGASGTGKSTLVSGLAEAALRAGADCMALGADPGNPTFGLPGAATFVRRMPDAWRIEQVAALCSLDAARFRLPLVLALRELDARARATDQPLLIDAPGVARGMAGAELLSSLVSVLEPTAVIVLVQNESPFELSDELFALGPMLRTYTAASLSRLTSRQERALSRTRLWNAYLTPGAEVRLTATAIALLGAPPPLHAAAVWPGRQVALLDDSSRTLLMGEAMGVLGEDILVRVPAELSSLATGARALLVRDARRDRHGLLRTATAAGPGLWGAEGEAPGAAGDLVPRTARLPGPVRPPVIRVANASLVLVNGVLGDPLVHLRFRAVRRSLLFDLGEALRLPARVAHQVSDVFVSHAHLDHFAGFLWLIRSRIGEQAPCRIFGPPGLALHALAMLRAIEWDRIGETGPTFEICELHGERVARWRLRAGNEHAQELPAGEAAEGVLLDEPGFVVTAATLDHGIPSIGYALAAAPSVNVDKERLAESGLGPGPWLNALKDALRQGDDRAPVRLPSGTVRSAGSLASLVTTEAGQKLVYATDFADTTENRGRIIALARGAHTLVCESTFLIEDADQARRTRHLTTRACAEIAREAAVTQLVPHHLSRRYEHAPEAVYRELLEYFPALVVPPLVRARLLRTAT